ncbi:MAG: hypothetical protein FD167_5178, partial [bacterium]
MDKDKSPSTNTYSVLTLLLVGIFLSLFFIPLDMGQAQQSSPNSSSTVKAAGFSDNIAANTLCSAGLGCERVQSQQSSSTSLLSGIFGASDAGPNFDPVISVVNIPGQTAVYRIIKGQKHSIPTEEIFYSYGFDLDIVQKITKTELDKYPLARLFIVEGSGEENPTIYYLTDTGMLRPILNDKVFYSYGNRKEDIITINQKEFNYYPRNEFVFVERPQLNRDIY